MKTIDSLGALMEQELRDVYNAEQQLIDALPVFIESTTSPELKQALEDHLDETREQVKRLERVFASMEIPVKGKKCRGIEGIINEGKELLKQEVEESVLDAGIISALQKAEHYEIATYGCLCSWAALLGFREAKDLLGKSIEEEKAADEILSGLASEAVNANAVDLATAPVETG